jgi:hypothetical protein
MRFASFYGLKLALASTIFLTLAACATATPFQVSGGEKDNAVVSGTSGLSFLKPNGDTASIQSVNGKPLGASESSVMLPPGHYTFSVRCFLGGNLLRAASFGNQDISIDVEAGHQYQFDVDPPDGDSKECASYVYDSTDGRQAYSETAHIPLDKGEAGKWKSADGGAHAGHTVADVIPKGQNEKNWQQMFEIESWTKLMFPGTADAFFQQQVANAKKICADTAVNVILETPDDISYEFEIGAGCSGTQIRSQFGRFLTGKLGIYHAVFISHISVPEADKTKWLKSLHDTTVIDMK